jgi:hypothetical protein
MIGDVLIVKSKDGMFSARPIGTGEWTVDKNPLKWSYILRCLLGRNPGEMRWRRTSKTGQPALVGGVDRLSSRSLSDVIKEVSVRMLLTSMSNPSMSEAILYRHIDGRVLKRVESGEIQIQDEKSGSVLSVHDGLEKAWSSILKP